MRIDNKKCAICGDRKATTSEHIPPKSIFLKPKPNDLITVPACDDCNNGTAKEDERFKVFLSLIIGDHEGETRRYFDENVLPTLNHSIGLKKRILDKSEEVLLSTPNGIVYEDTGKIEIERHCFDVVMNKCIRGLYYKQYQEILGDQVLIEVSYRRSIDDNFYEAGMKLVRGGSLGDDAFVYKHVRAMDDPLESFWILQFYKRFWVVASTKRNS